MKVDFLGFKGNRWGHQDWAIDILPETEFEKSFFSALFCSDRFVPNKPLKQMQPIAALLYKGEIDSITVMVSAENFRKSALVKAEQRIIELEQALKEK